MNRYLLIEIFIIAIILAVYLAFHLGSGDTAQGKAAVYPVQIIKDYKKATGHIPTQQEVVNAQK